MSNYKPAGWGHHVSEPNDSVLLDGALAPAAFASDELRFVEGLPSPIFFEGTGASPNFGAWQIRSGATIEPFVGGFPAIKYFDKFAFEPWSGRVLGIDSDTLYSYDFSSGQFKDMLSLRAANGEQVRLPLKQFFDIKSISRLGTTLIGTNAGAYRVIGNEIEPLTVSGQENTHEVTSIIDLPNHHAVAFVNTSGGQNSPSVMLRTDDGIDRFIARGANQDKFVDHIYESLPPGRLLLRGSFQTLEVEMELEGSNWVPHRSWMAIDTREATFPGYMVTDRHETLVFGRPGSLWGRHGLERLDATGLHAVPGDAIDAPERQGLMMDMPARRAVLINGLDGWYLFDGNKTTRIPESEPNVIGDWSSPAALSSIGRFFIVSTRGIFEVTSNGLLKKVEVPFPIVRGSEPYLTDFPPAHVGIISITGSSYLIDDSLQIHKITESAIGSRSVLFTRGLLDQRALIVMNSDKLQLLGKRSDLKCSVNK